MSNKEVSADDKGLGIVSYWRRKVVLPVSVSLAGSCLLVLLVAAQIVYNFERKHHEAIADTTASLLSESILIGDMVEVVRRASTVANRYDVQLNVFDKDNNLLAIAGNGLREQSTMSMRREIVASDGRICGYLSMGYNLTLIPLRLAAGLALLLITLLGLVWFFAVRSSYPIVRDIVALMESFKSAPFQETKFRFQEFQRAYQKYSEQAERLVHAEADRVRGELTSQVAHDIRSPLSALNMVMATALELPENKRLIIRNATQRINDIANSLLSKSKATQVVSGIPATDFAEPVLLSALVDAIVSEKRVQFRDRMGIEIQGNLEKSYGLFAAVNGAEFTRVLSNLVNNSVEALVDGTGFVTVGVERRPERPDEVIVFVADNGKGISSENLIRLGERGFTIGKEKGSSGSGLGLAHARETIERVAGKLQIDSGLGVGTRVSIHLPQAKAPDWFLETIPEATMYVSVDDDQTIHQIWSGRIHSSLAGRDFSHKTFTSLSLFIEWLHGSRTLKDCYFFIDYEYLGQTGNGLDVVEQFDLASQAVLVTSRYEEPHVRARAKKLNVKILPKALAPFVPMAVSSTRAQSALIAGY